MSRSPQTTCFVRRANHFDYRNRVKPQIKNIPLHVGQITGISPASPTQAFRDRHVRWVLGCGGRFCSGALFARERMSRAYGEVVWSWVPRRWRKLCESFRGDGGNKARSPGRARRRSHCAGDVGLPPPPCMLVCAKCVTLAHGSRVQRAPGIPCALCLRGHEFAKLRMNARAKRRKHALPSLRSSQ